MPYIIVDLDGSLCNDSHRKHLAEAKQWDEYYGLIECDSINWYVKSIISSFVFAYRDGKVVLLTGRCRRYETATRNWLGHNRVQFHHLLMRPAGDYSQTSVQFKIAMINQFNAVFGYATSDCFLAIEDLPEMVSLLKIFNIPVLQVHQKKG